VKISIFLDAINFGVWKDCISFGVQKTPLITHIPVVRCEEATGDYGALRELKSH
jgi:hypothetical protein